MNLYNDYPPIDKYIQLIWNGENNRGYKTSSGLYFLRHTAGNIIESEKFILLY